MIRNLVLAVGTTVAVAALSVGSAIAAPSDLDPAYGSAGMAILPNTFIYGAGFSALDDGTSVVAGRFMSGDKYRFSVARFSPAGTLDTSFKPPTGVLTPGPSSNDSVEANAIALNDKGVFVAGRELTNDASLAYAYQPPSLDSFAYSIYFDHVCTGRAAHSLPGGAHLLAGYCTGDTTTPIVARYTSSGNLDTSFGSSGPGWEAPSTTRGIFSAVTTQPDGKIVAAGSSETGDYLLVRTTSDGQLDNGFTDGVTGSPGLRGRVVAPIGPASDNASAVVAQPDGKIVAAGSSADLTDSLHPSIARFNSDGSPDPSFGDGGKKILTLTAATSYIQAIDLQPDGKIVAAGLTGGLTFFRLFVARFTTNGQLDPTFGSGGILTNVPGSTRENSVMGVKVLPNGKILVGSQLTIAGNTVVGVLGLLGDPIIPGGRGTAKPTAKFKSPSKRKLKAKKFKSMTGSATGATSVQVAVLMTDKKLLKKKKRCLQMKNSKAALKKVKSVKRKCQPSVWLTARGTSNWSYKLKKPLKPGKYTLYVRASGAGGLSANVKRSLTLTP